MSPFPLSALDAILRRQSLIYEAIVCNGPIAAVRLALPNVDKSPKKDIGPNTASGLQLRIRECPCESELLIVRAGQVQCANKQDQLLQPIEDMSVFNPDKAFP